MLTEKINNENIVGEITPFNNGLEQGLVLNICNGDDSINIWAYQCHKSDLIKIIIGGNHDKDYTNMFSDNAHKYAGYFNHDDYDVAVKYTYNLIKLNLNEKEYKATGDNLKI